MHPVSPEHNMTDGGLMQLERVQVFKIDSVLERPPSDPLTESDVTPLSGESSDVIKHLLAKPIKFTCVILSTRSRRL